MSVKDEHDLTSVNLELLNNVEGITRLQKIDGAICKILSVKESAPKSDEIQKTEKIFSYSMALSGFRCLLSYVILPFILPLINVAANIGPYLGIPIGITAVVFDIFGMRRFFAAKHKYRYAISVIYLMVIALVTGLVISDFIHLFKL